MERQSPCGASPLRPAGDAPTGRSDQPSAFLFLPWGHPFSPTGLSFSSSSFSRLFLLSSLPDNLSYGKFSFSETRACGISLVRLCALFIFLIRLVRGAPSSPYILLVGGMSAFIREVRKTSYVVRSSFSRHVLLTSLLRRTYQVRLRALYALGRRESSRIINCIEAKEKPQKGWSSWLTSTTQRKYSQSRLAEAS